MKNLFNSLVIALGALSAQAAAEPLVGYDTWAGIPRHPAQVNAVCPKGREILSLRGEWECALGRHGNGWRTWGMQYTNEWGLTGSLQVPGSWEAQGVGDEGIGLPHLCQDQAPKPMRHVYRGEMWYRKSVEIPKKWEGRRIWFKTGGFRSVGTVWVNDHPVARVANFCAAWKYDITPFVKPGEYAKIVMSVDNAVSPRNAQMDGANRWGGVWRDIELEATPFDCWIDEAWARGDFDGRKARVVVEMEGGQRCGELSLRATVEGASSQRPLSTFTSSTSPSPSPSTSTSTPTPTSSSTFTLDVPLRHFRPWSPECPNLYTAKVELVSADGRILQTRYERFGIRKLEVRGKEFYLNGRPFFVRGFGDDSVYPLTGLSPADRDFHREHLGKAHAAGFNFVRLHTHTETAEYFDAADECGILVQPELSYYMDNTEDDFLYDPLADVRELHLACRRHPSFGFYSCGNEGSVGPYAGKIVGDWIRANDPDRLFVEEDGGSYLHPGHGEGRMTHASGPLKPWERGSFNPRAFICHEYLNLCVKCDSRDENLYTGVWKPPVTRSERAWWLRQHGLDEVWGDRLQSSQHALQKFWFKQGLESARMDPYCDGYCLWTIADVVVRNAKAATYSAQGLFNPFWNEKRGGMTVRELAAINAPTVILLDNEGKGDRAYREDTSRLLCNSPWAIEADREGTNRVYAAGETIPADFLLAHFGEAELKDAVLEWKLATEEETLASGRKELGDQPCGPARLVAREWIAIPDLKTAVKATLTATLTSPTPQTSQTSQTPQTSQTSQTSNSWTFYLFPRRKPMKIEGLAATADLYDLLAPRYLGLRRYEPSSDSQPQAATLLICRDGSPEHRAARAAGVKTVALSNQTGPANIALGWWRIGPQAGTAFIAHPAFKYLPFEEYLTPLYFRILKEGTPLGTMRGGTNVMPAANMRPTDVIAAGEGGEQCYFYLAETKTEGVVDGMRISGLDVLSDTPEGMALLDGVLEYLFAPRKGDVFMPEEHAAPDAAPIPQERKETARWQAAIDRAAAAGGGTVTMPAGNHLVGTLFLRSGVTLELAEGCVLEGSWERTDYPDIPIKYAELREPWQGLVVAVDQDDVAVVGRGTIHGNGRKFPHGVRLGRPQGLMFINCRGVKVEGVRLVDLARWTCYLKECDGCEVRNVTVDSHANANNDGIDIDARNVLVENCDFDADDDGIVFKSDNADFLVENVVVRNCKVRSTCSAIKIGTGSHGGFRNILIENIEGGASPREWCDPKTGKGVISTYRVETWPGSEFTPSTLSGIAVECVDGGLLENVTIRNVTVERAATPVFIRGGLRFGRRFGGIYPLGLPFGEGRALRHVLIENYRCKATSYTASSITGVPGLTLEDIVLRNVEIEMPGSGEAGRAEIGRPVPENADGYPESNMFDHRMLPAYGFFIRHAEGVVFDNVNVKVTGREFRPEIVRLP